MKTVRFSDLIIYEDQDYILINKPPYISTLDERNAPGMNSIIAMAKKYHADAQVCHRIDKETSGVLAIAKNKEAYRNLAMQFEHREVLKTYHAVVGGVHDFKDIDVFLPIHQLADGSVKIDKTQGKVAETIFNTLKVYKKHTLVECFPLTGRMHQIRVHLLCLNASIAGDALYGGENIFLSELKRKFNLKKDTDERPLMQRVALHAYLLKFKGLDGKEIEAIAEYPKDFAVLIKQLEKYAS